MPIRPNLRFFVFRNVIVWIAMTSILVIVPDSLERWLGLEIARIAGWVGACAVWVVSVESLWKARYRVLPLFFIRITFWLSTAWVAIKISELYRIG
jgi:hypothetical protein